MNFLILGDGPEEHAWARSIAASTEHSLSAAYPGFADMGDVLTCRDIDDALATRGIDAVVVGGDPGARSESLRRVATAGLPAICLHPPGPDSEAYYQVSMARMETGAVLVPDLPARLHPGVEALQMAMVNEELGTYRGLRFESPADTADGDLARHAFARADDLVRSLVGEIEAVTATGDPAGERPTESLVAQLRADQGRRVEVRLWAGPSGPARLIFNGSAGSLTLELPADLRDVARLVKRPTDRPEEVTEFEGWDPQQVILDVLTASMSGRDVHPDLADGTRAMEVSEGVVRSLRRGRTVELHYEEISEAGTFKSVMTSIGCLVLAGILLILPLALAGPALGIGWTIYIAYLIPPVLIGFVLLQLFRFAAHDPKKAVPPPRKADPS